MRWMTMSSAALALSAALIATGCDFFVPGEPAEEDIFDAPFDTLTRSQARLFVKGDEEFDRVFSFNEGLGPIFNAPSCGSCHPGEGPGHPEFGFFRFGRYDDDGNFDPMLDEGGPQLQDRAIPGYQPEVLPEGDNIVATRLMAPSVTGLGLLEAVDDATILALADPDDEDGDGISGRINWIKATDTLDQMAALAERAGGARIQPHDGYYIGRFGLKGSAISLLHQTVNAYHQDMGLTSKFAMVDPVNFQVGDATGDLVPDPEISQGTLMAVNHYLRTLRPPLRRNANKPEVRAGERLFEEINCAACHTPTLKTGVSTIAALSEVEFHPYTDLLMYDMGPELDDGYTEGTARSSEWRTRPLWGLGLSKHFQGGRAFYLHDGRATSLREAIELHGGEPPGILRSNGRRAAPITRIFGVLMSDENLTRRSFVKVLCAGALGGLVGCNTVPRYLLEPPTSDAQYQVPISAFDADGRLVAVSADGAKSYLIMREADGYSAVELTCTHRGCGLQVRAEELHCPCHGSRFTPRGQVLEGPAQKPLKTIDITRRGDTLLLG